MSTLEGFRQSIGLVGDKDKMDVIGQIGHEAIAEQSYVRSLDVLSEQFKVDVAIRIAVEDETACVAALRDVVGDFCDDHSGQACHQALPEAKALLL